MIELVINEIKNDYKNNFLNRNEWEMKSFGMVTRGSYLFIENFPCEIHFNEPLQMQVSKEITHRIYELFRINIGTNEKKEEFKTKFLEFLKDINNNKYQKFNNIIEESLKINYSYNDLKDIELLNIKKELLNLHINIHQEEILKTQNDWQVQYLVALYKYNQNSQLKIIPSKNFKDEVIILANIEYKKQNFKER